MHPEYRFDLDAHLGDCTGLNVLNLGAGHCSSPISGQFLTLKCGLLMNVEVYEPIFRQLDQLHFESPTTNYRGEIGDFVIKEFPFAWWDVVAIIDVLEHLTRGQGLRLLYELTKRTRKRVVVFVPCKECPQGDLEGNPWQKHLSTWIEEDFGLGWEKEVYPGFHTHLNPPVDAGWFTYRRER